MSRPTRTLILSSVFLLGVRSLPAAPPAVWSIDDLQRGMKGTGVSVFQGTQLATFDVEVLGILKKFGPGRSAVIARLSGQGLEKTGVLAGMSGSPVTIDDKLVGAVAFTWPFLKEPIAGITPFGEMVDFAVGGFAQRSVLAPIGELRLDRPWEETLALLAPTGHRPTDGRMMPIALPVAMGGLSPSGLASMQSLLQPLGMIPLQAEVGSARTNKPVDVKLAPGGAMGVGLVTGDVELTAIGTITAVIEDRVYGFGHPFFEIGACDLPLYSAQIETILPMMTVGTKMGAPIAEVGAITADVSSCVAGSTQRRADLIPLTLRMQQADAASPRSFNCKVIRHPMLIGPMTLNVLVGCATVEGAPPPELTVQFGATVELEGEPPLQFEDVYSGPRFAGERGMVQAFGTLGNLLTILSNNAVDRPRIKSIACQAQLKPVRSFAKIIAAAPLEKVLEPGEELNVAVTLLPDRQGSVPAKPIQRRLTIMLPPDMPVGRHSATVCDGMTQLQSELQQRRHLINPSQRAQLLESLQLQTKVRRTDLCLRLNLSKDGVVVNGAELPNLPASIAAVMQTDPQAVIASVRSTPVSIQASEWLLDGSNRIEFEVVKDKGQRLDLRPAADRAGE